MNPNILDDVREKYKRKIRYYFRRKCVFKRVSRFNRGSKRRTMVMWAFECVDEIANELLLKYPDEKRIISAIDLCKAWALGDVKMPLAKKAILEVHAMAKETDNAYDIALLHAIGQGCSTVHVKTHAMGIVIYELTAIVLKYGIDNCEEAVQNKIDIYIEKLKRCEREIDTKDIKWAAFLLKDDVKKSMF